MATLSYKTVLQTPIVAEGTSTQLTATLKDRLGVAVPGTDLTHLTLTLYELESETVINSRDAQNILGVNGGSVSVAGVLTLELSELDNVLVSQDSGRETHVALFQYRYNGGSKYGKAEVHFPVANLAHVPTIP